MSVAGARAPRALSRLEAVAVGLMLAACAGKPQAASAWAAEPSYTFRCDDGFTVRAQFARDSARVAFPDTTLIMSRLVSADGGRYGAGDLVFWEKGTTAFVQRGDSIVYRSCAREE